MSKDPWHFPREELARRYLTALTRGPANALTMFGPRRIGKTEFLLRDLGPLAEREGHLVAYMSFWSSTLAPTAVLLRGLDSAVKERSLAERLKAMSSALTPKLTLKAPGGAGVEFDLTKLDGTPNDDLLSEIGDLIARLSKPKKPAILFLDEAQELARLESSRPLVAALRTALDTQSDGVRALFTGSSLEGLRAMFGVREAPFFQFGSWIDLEPLNEDFVDHMLGVVETMTKRKLDRDAALAAFDELHRSPFFFRHLMELLTLRADLEVPEAMEIYRERMAEQLGYRTQWLDLSPIQRASVRLLAEGQDRPFSQEAAQRLGEVLAEDPPSRSRVQTALLRLQNLGLADRWSGKWVLTDPEFGRWARQTAE